MLQRAAEIWADNLISDVPITIRAVTASQACDATSAVLASAGAASAFRDFPGAPLAGTWYHGALANSIAGVDLDPVTPDIQTQFNLNLDADPNCLGGNGWYYGFDHNEGLKTDLLATMLHEYGHGLGFANFCTESNGTLLQGFPDVYTTFTRDLETDKNWNAMTNAERQRFGHQRSGRGVDRRERHRRGAALHGPREPLHRQLAAGDRRAASKRSRPPSARRCPVPASPTPIILATDTGGVSVNDGCEAFTNGGAISRQHRPGRPRQLQLHGEGGQCPGGRRGGGGGCQQRGRPASDGRRRSDRSPSPRSASPRRLGTSIKGQLPSPGVNVTLGYDPTQFAGVNEGFLRVNAPNPLVTGSSISHWSPAATPSLLMEPAITPALTDDVDLTLEQFKDIGWILTEIFSDGFESGNCARWVAGLSSCSCSCRAAARASKRKSRLVPPAGFFPFSDRAAIARSAGRRRLGGLVHVVGIEPLEGRDRQHHGRLGSAAGRPRDRARRRAAAAPSA